MTDTIDPSSTALLVMDYQPSILGFLGDPGPLIDLADNAIKVVRGRGGQVGLFASRSLTRTTRAFRRTA